MGRAVDQGIIADFEVLVDELLKPLPDENQVKGFMEKLHMSYDSDSVRRISAVLEKMNALVFESKQRKVNNDLQ